MLWAPLLLLVGFVVHPPERHDADQLLEVITTSAGRWNAAHLMFALSMGLSIPAIVGPMGLLEQRGRGGRLALIGGSLAIVGVIFLTLFIGVELAMSAVASVRRSSMLQLNPQFRRSSTSRAATGGVRGPQPQPGAFRGRGGTNLHAGCATLGGHRYRSSGSSAGRGIVQQPDRGSGCSNAAGWPGRNRSASTQAVLSTHARIFLG